METLLVEGSVKKRILNILIVLDQLIWVLISLGKGSPDETISSASYRGWLHDHPIGKIAKPVIDFLFLPIQKNHCRKAWESEVLRKQLPKSFREAEKYR